MAVREFKCIVCDQPERACTCPHFCALCQADYSLRLCEDGQYYCADCREACGYRTQDGV